MAGCVSSQPGPSVVARGTRLVLRVLLSSTLAIRRRRPRAVVQQGRRARSPGRYRPWQDGLL